MQELESFWRSHREHPVSAAATVAEQCELSAVNLAYSWSPLYRACFVLDGSRPAGRHSINPRRGRAGPELAAVDGTAVAKASCDCNTDPHASSTSSHSTWRLLSAANRRRLQQPESD